MRTTLFDRLTPEAREKYEQERETVRSINRRYLRFT